jgi:hypothetical protein
MNKPFLRSLAVISLLAVSFGLSSCARPTQVNFQKELQEKLIKAKAGDVIEIPEGKFQLDRTLSLTADKVTVRGKGMDKTILSFAGQKEGAQGMLVKANDFTIEDLAIEDSAGDGLTMQGGNNITVRRVRVEWTRGPIAATAPMPSTRRNVETCWWKILSPRARRTRDSTLGNPTMS